MPYIITTTHYDGSPMPSGRTRRAVATLDEAKQVVPIRWNVPKSGASITLDDGTTITVELVKWDDLRERAFAAGAASPLEREIGDNGQPIIDAFNGAQSHA